MDEMNFDRELRAVLDAAPSPDFIARTRIKVAEQSRQRARFGWLMPLAAGVAIAAGAVVMNMRSGIEKAESRAELAVLTSRPLSVPIGVLPSIPSQQPSARAVAGTDLSDRQEVVGPQIPFVLIAEADRRAFEQLVAAVRRQTLEASFDQIPASEQWLNSELTVAPINIPPLEPSAAQNN